MSATLLPSCSSMMCARFTFPLVERDCVHRWLGPEDANGNAIGGQARRRVATIGGTRPIANPRLSSALAGTPTAIEKMESTTSHVPTDAMIARRAHGSPRRNGVHTTNSSSTIQPMVSDDSTPKAKNRWSTAWGENESGVSVEPNATQLNRPSEMPRHTMVSPLKAMTASIQTIIHVTHSRAGRPQADPGAAVGAGIVLASGSVCIEGSEEADHAGQLAVGG